MLHTNQVHKQGYPTWFNVVKSCYQAGESGFVFEETSQDAYDLTRVMVSRDPLYLMKPRQYLLLQPNHIAHITENLRKHFFIKFYPLPYEWRCLVIGSLSVQPIMKQLGPQVIWSQSYSLFTCDTGVMTALLPRGLKHW